MKSAIGGWSLPQVPTSANDGIETSAPGEGFMSRAAGVAGAWSANGKVAAIDDEVGDEELRMPAPHRLNAAAAAAAADADELLDMASKKLGFGIRRAAQLRQGLGIYE